MSVRNSHARQSKNYIIKNIGTVQYMFKAAPWASMSKLRYIANKAVSGKVELDETKRLIELQEDGSLIYKVL